MSAPVVIPQWKVSAFEKHTGLGSLVETFADLGLVKIEKDVKPDGN
jgi:hypothetical protein